MLQGVAFRAACEENQEGVRMWNKFKAWWNAPTEADLLKVKYLDHQRREFERQKRMLQPYIDAGVLAATEGVTTQCVM